jgi:ribosomal-protein-alanine N-acetyltransferase
MAPELQTRRLRLRSWRESDAADGFAIYGDPEVTRTLGLAKPMVSLDEMRRTLLEWIAKYSRPEMLQWGAWALELTGPGTVVGMELLNPTQGPDVAIEIGWHLGRQYWGRGFATEAGAAVIRYAFETCKLDEIVALIVPENGRSAGVARRLGLSLAERTSRFNGFSCDVWKLTRMDWHKTRTIDDGAA